MSTPARLIPIPSPTVAPSAARDFDFLMGPWRIRNRRLVRRLAGCHDWEVFDATGSAHPLPVGIGNFDTFTPLAWKPGYVGMALRVFDTRHAALEHLLAGQPHGRPGPGQRPVAAARGGRLSGRRGSV